ncbi:MAG: hypothetical protein A2W31_11485 [Planctomycetes bacterium RBG_16_64_10]|nr:MAG: hypothetical protein A2W31_11485 [Planctomycetes bacterium RBG_16_64_10]
MLAAISDATGLSAAVVARLAVEEAQPSGAWESKLCGVRAAVLDADVREAVLQGEPIVSIQGRMRVSDACIRRVLAGLGMEVPGEEE